MKSDPKQLALAYLEAVGRKELGKVQELLAPDVAFIGPAMTRSSAPELMAAFKRLGAIHVRNEVKKVFVDGNDVCLIYDFITDTQVGALPTIEWLRIEDGAIRSIHLYYDQLPWKTVLEEMARRA